MIKTIPIPSPLFGPNTPEWQLWITLAFSLISAVAALGWGYILEYKYTSPYTLSTASTAQKWRWAAIIMFWQTLMIPILGLVEPILSPVPDQWPAFPLFCSGLWVVIFPLVRQPYFNYDES